jgi:hypothetical protein
VVEAIDSMVAVQREKTAPLPFWNIKDVARKGSQATDLALMARLLLGGVVALEMVGTVGHVCAKDAETYGSDVFGRYVVRMRGYPQGQLFLDGRLL